MVAPALVAISYPHGNAVDDRRRTPDHIIQFVVDDGDDAAGLHAGAHRLRHLHLKGKFIRSTKRELFAKMDAIGSGSQAAH